MDTLTIGQTLLLERAISLLLIMLASASVSAYVFRNVQSCAFMIGTFILSIVGIFAAIFAAQTGNIFLIALASVFFGASVGSILGMFVIASVAALNAKRASGESRKTNPVDPKKVVEAIAITIGVMFVTTLIAAGVGLFSGVNFQGLGSILFMGLFVVMGISLVGIVIKRRLWMETMLGLGVSAFWVVYLVYDFNKVVTKFIETDGSWVDAMEVAMGIFLDLVNLFVWLFPLILDVYT